MKKVYNITKGRLEVDILEEVNFVEISEEMADFMTDHGIKMTDIFQLAHERLEQIIQNTVSDKLDELEDFDLDVDSAKELDEIITDDIDWSDED
ncbi:hypothetical protein P4V41_07600 [Fictibacillus nanhaiensis]|uniref:hypothetical protein n=1 Tax=Fictibacillus nanhaiensis TaxID=742169 RepID=UPI002E22E696|nr:hypothetical protein [Fictibacillus nanhaiensis]